MGVVLLFNVNIFKSNQIQVVCDRLGHKVKCIKKEDYNMSVGELAGIVPGLKPNKASSGNDKFPHQTNGLTNETKEFAHEMMVFSGINSEALDVFLAAYKEARISPIPRKAIITPANFGWSVIKLYEDLDEHVRLG